MPFRSATALPTAIVVVTLDPAASADVVEAVRGAWPGVPVHLRTPDRPLADGACSAREPVAVVLDLPADALDAAIDTAIAHALENDCTVGLAVVDRGLATALDAERLARLDQRVPCQLDPATTDARGWRRHLHAIVREALESAAHLTLAHELRRTLDTLRLAQRAGRVGVFDWDHAAARGIWSEGLYDLCGVAHGTPVTLALRERLLSPDEDDRLLARLRAAWAAREAEFELDVRITRESDEEPRWVWCRGRIEYDADGAPRRLVGTAADVTHERLAREAVDRAESRLLAMYDAAEAGIVHAGLDGALKYVNGAFARLVGREAHVLLGGMTIDDITDPEDLALERAVRGVHGVSGAPFDFQKRFVRPDGSRVWVHVTGGVIRDGTGRPAGAIGIVVDITARRAAERALRDSEEQLRQAAALAGLVSGELDLVSGKVTGSQGLAAFLGLDALPRRASLAALLLAVHHDDRAETARRLAAALDPAGDGRFEREHRYVGAPDAAPRWHQLRGQVRFEGEGAQRRAVRFLFTALDVTARRRQEDEGRVREERLELAFDALGGLVYDWDASTGETMRSGEMARITGWHPHEVPDDVAWWQSLVHDDDTPALRDHWIAYERDGQERATQEYRIRHRDGHWVWVQDHSRAVRAADGSLERLIGITISIDDRKRAEERIEAARRDAEAANAAKDRFLAVLSHELRTPLAPVALLTTMLQRRADLPRDAHAHLGTIRKNVELQIKLIDDLLDLTRIARGKLELRATPVALGPAIDEVLAMVAADADARQLRLVRTGDAHALRVRADSARLQQMLWNLVRNAVKFTPACGTVTVHADADGDDVRVSVTDTGIGIPAAQLAKVFDPFVQADPTVTREFGGLGLGLYITRALAQQHGGDVAVASEGPGQGASFTLVLPRAAEPLPTATAEHQRDALATTRGAGRRILLVEDHEDTAHAVSMLLRSMEFEPVVAHSVAEGIRRFHADRDVAAVVTDLGLPDGSGAELLQHLQSHFGHESLPPCLVMSGFGMQHDIERSLALGFAAHLVKPVSSERLAEALGAALERPRAVPSPV